MKTITIYGLIDPNDGHVKYIGKTSNIKKRLSEHINTTLKKNKLTKKEAWIKSLINKNLKPEIFEIDAINNKEWKFWEQHYICLFKSWGFDLKNLTDGGDGWESGNVPWNKGIPHTKEFKERLSKLKIGKLNNRFGVKLSKEIINKIQNSRNVKIFEIGEKISKGKKNKKFSNEHKDSLKKSWELSKKNNERTPWNKGITGYTTTAKGRTVNDEIKKQISKTLSKFKVIQKDINNNIIKEWYKFELKNEGFSISNITSVCLKKRKTAHGYKWEYKENGFGG